MEYKGQSCCEILGRKAGMSEMQKERRKTGGAEEGRAESRLEQSTVDIWNTSFPGSLVYTACLCIGCKSEVLSCAWFVCKHAKASFLTNNYRATPAFLIAAK